jgi:type I restriction enzyme S subunit
LPPDWRWVKLDSACTFEYGKALKKGNRDHTGKYPVYGSNGPVGFHNEYLVQGPGVVIGRKGGAGEVAYVRENFWPIDTTYFLKLNTGASLTYFYFLLRSLQLSRFDKSTAIPGLNRNDAYDLEIPLPPLATQQAIVAKIEELFSELDKGIESIKLAQQQLKTYRQSVLKAAFEGRLVGAQDFVPQQAGQLPAGWQWVKLEQILERISNGANVQQHEENVGLPISRIETIWNEHIDIGRVKFIKENATEFIEKYALRIGDILFSHINSDIHLGKTAIYRGTPPILIHGINLLLIRFKSGMLPQFMNYQFKHKRNQGLFIQIAQKSVNQSSINQAKLKNVDFIVPPLAEQQAIVAAIESRLSVADQLEATLAQSLQQAEALRQSVLKKAFSGELVGAAHEPPLQGRLV